VSPAHLKRPQDHLVEALKRLGGLAHLGQIYPVFGEVSGRHVDAIVQAKVRQTLQTFSSDASWDRPKSAPDLFYSLDGVAAASGIWGLRRYSPQAPSDYPIAGVDREYVVLLRREDTTLFNQRGIAYKNGRVLGLHVDFGPEGDYPDRLLEDGSIEHIGEGKGPVQTETAGNLGMLQAIETNERIPVYQYVAPDRYAPLGEYIVTAFRREAKQLSSNFMTEAFVFVLKPAGMANSQLLRTVSDGEVTALALEAGEVSFLMAPEGKLAFRTHLGRERDPGNRSAVIRAKGFRCEACGFHFGERYGPEIDGFIEVHHIRPIAAGEYTPTILDFAVLCANCHRAAHKGRGRSPRTVAELRALLHQD
jgi:HNH endonuclease